MTEQPNDQGQTHPSYGGTQPGTPGGGPQQPGAPHQGPQPGPQHMQMAPLQPVTAGPPQPMAVSHEVPPDAEGMYKEGIGYGLWCLWLFGMAGVHRIYMGKYGTGILFLLTWGLFGIGQFVDLFRMKGLIKDANIREGYLPHPRLARRMQGPPVPQQVAASQSGSLPPGRVNVQQALLKAAQANGGALTVTQGVVTTGLTFEQVEEILREMVAKGYVDVDNAPNSGVVVYRFPELSGPFN
ncbi:MAG: TM2 domain-containing protein [Gemmatimonadota bacterium]|nr:TM2 domain-containing protein [Gemmatimonadota bacterium]